MATKEGVINLISNNGKDVDEIHQRNVMSTKEGVIYIEIMLRL